MATTSGRPHAEPKFSKTLPLKTYSRRFNTTQKPPDNHTTHIPPGKRKLRADSQSVVELPPAKKFARSSIQSYFQPLSSSPSPAPTPSPDLLFSDDLEPRSTPPSSPPQETGSPPTSSRRPRQRLKRRLSTKPKPPPITRMPHATEPNSLPRGTERVTQTQLSLGSGSTQVICRDCNRLYDTTVATEVVLHRACRYNLGGAATSFPECHLEYYENPSGSGNVEVVTYLRVTSNSRSAGLHAMAGHVLCLVDEELGGPGDADGQFQLYIALIGRYLVGALVVEEGTRSGAYTRPDFHGGNTSTTTTTNNVIMCVDQIWVRDRYRRGAITGTHIATTLLDLARHRYFSHFDLVVRKSQVSFSPPTGPGWNFARKYFQGEYEETLPGHNVELLVRLSV